FQIDLDGPALPADRTTFGPLTNLTAFAEQSRTTFSSSAGRLSIILSPPQQFIDMPAEQVLAHLLPQLDKLAIDLSGHIKQVRKIVLPMDFYSLGTGCDQLRPLQKTPVQGLTLAGDYTRQRYLGTMEGAVYSGKLTAKLVRQML